MHCFRSKLRAIVTLSATVWMISTPAAHAHPRSSFNPFILKEPAEKIRAIFPEPVGQARAPSNFALQGSQRLLSKIASRASDVVDNALKQIGVRYRNGGNTPKKGFDCSGLVHYVFQNTLGLTLPRRADAMSRIGNKITVDNLKPGDLVFFNTRRRTFSHVGIFIGNHQFVHSPSKGRRVRIDSLDNRYWERHFTGARRFKFRDAASCPRSRFVDRFLGYSGRLNRSMTFILLLVLLLIAAGCALLKWVRTSGFFCCAAGLFFWSVGSGLPAQWLLTDLQAAYANDAPPEWGKRNAIVMLGAGTVQIPDAHQVEAGTLAYARILKTFALYQACRKSGQRCTVIVSGGDAQHHGLFGSGGLWWHIARPGRCGFRAAA